MYDKKKYCLCLFHAVSHIKIFAYSVTANYSNKIRLKTVYIFFHDKINS